MVRITWLNWLASLFVLFATPVVLLQMPGVYDLVAIRVGSAGFCGREDCAPEPWLLSHTDWSLEDLFFRYPLWLSMLLAAVVPTLLHVRFRNRLAYVFERWPKAAEPGDPATYRSALAYSVRANPRAFVAHVQYFFMRMVAAMAVSGIAYWTLVGPRLTKNYGCVFYSNTYNIPEYTIYIMLMLVVVLVHMPLPGRVFGFNAQDYRTWRRREA
jgi:hypothetical protein